ncbi:MAG: dockerin type I repeat-containing protein [candidate division Zixibacteria bacterium]|nr:dockerin type I repeat-containing protein [candidate division Zixibacteria bacterium]
MCRLSKSLQTGAGAVSLWLTVLGIGLLMCGSAAFGQVSLSGDITAHVDSVINEIADETPHDLYSPLSASQQTLWRQMIQDIMAGDFASAHSSAITIDYRIAEYTDTESPTGKVYYILERTPGTSTNYWGTFIFNPEPRRPKLVIQCPHPLQNRNTANQGFRVFRAANARACFIAGTHKCNSTSYSPCDGTSTSCSETAEPYRDCDQAHIVVGTFQLSTEEMLTSIPDMIVIQPHGYTKGESDPDIIMSNGTQDTPTMDYLPSLRDNLLSQDGTLTFKIPHIDTEWTYYIGHENAQGRLINESVDPCESDASYATGNFIHLEQGYSKLRDTEANWAKLANAVIMTFPALGEMTTAQSGSWTDPATWGGSIPTFEDDVVISAGHTISVDDIYAECHSVIFGDTAAHIDMNAGARLSVYGDFTIFNEEHNVFSAGWSADGAVICFTGYAPAQTLSGWSTTGGSTSFRDVIIDKPSGKVTTAGTGMRLGIQNSLLIANGTLELAVDDDLEARWASSGFYTANQNLAITVNAGGSLILVDGDGSHFIRSDVESVPIGPMTVYGEVKLYDASMYYININNINVKDGGVLELGTSLYSATYGPEFNPGTITVESGGSIANETSSDIWIDTSVVDLQLGGTYKTTTTTTYFAPTFYNNGKVRYQRDPDVATTDQEVVDTDYYQVEFSFNGNGTRKVWTLEDSRGVTDSLTINNSAEFVLNAATPQTLTVNGTLRLTSGSIDNSDANTELALADGAQISRATGTISDAPTFLGVVDLRYTSTTNSVATGPEFPTSSSALRDLTIYSTDQTVTLSNDATLNGTLTLSAGTFDNDGEENDYTFSFADGATIRRATAALTAVPNFGSTVNLEYISTIDHVTTSYEMPIGTSVLNNLTITGDEGVTLGADVTVNGTLAVNGSALYTDGHTLTLGPSAAMQENGYTVVGTVAVDRTCAQATNEIFGGIGVEINAAEDDPGATSILRITGAPATIDDVQGVARIFDISPTVNTGLNATLVVHYDESELNGILEETLALYYSDDGGSTWTVRGGVVDDVANTVTLTGVDSFSRWTLAGVAGDMIVSAQSGSWTDPSTWAGSAVPLWSDDVLIASGHTISVDDTLAECHSLSFGGNDALIDMNPYSRLSVYGDFTLFSTDHNVFSAGWTADSAFVRFTGDEPVQTLSGWNTEGGSTSFRDAIIDKEIGTVVTTAGNSMRLCVQNSLRIVSGSLIMAPGDDLEARWSSSGNFTHDQSLMITVDSAGAWVFEEGDGTHFVRSGAGEPIGKLTVYGDVSFCDASSYDYHIGGIDIKNGGQFEIGTGLGSTTYGPEFNPGTITIDSGGALLNTTTTDVWFDTSIVDLKRGGTYKTSSSTTVFPPTLINDGKVRYQRNPETVTTDQIVVDTNYYDIEFSFNGNATKKLWELNDNRAVVDSLIVNNDADFVLTASGPYQLTVHGLVRMTSGSIDNSVDGTLLVLADDAWISRAYGTMAAAPDFLGQVNVRYTSATVSVTTGPELPTDGTTLKDLVIYSADQTVTLGNNATVNGDLTLSMGIFDNNGTADDKVLSLADGSSIRRATGELTTAPAFGSSVNVEYISTVGAVVTGPELPTDPSLLNDLTITGNMGVTLGADVTVNGTLAVHDSILSTGAYLVTLAAGATLVEDSTFVVQGQVTTTRTVSQSVAEDFGGLGLELTAAGAAPGTTTILRETGTAPSIGGGTAILRSYTVTPAVNTGLNATLVFHYVETELNGLTEGALVPYVSSDGSTWNAVTGTVDQVANTVTVTGLGELHQITLGGTSDYLCGDANSDEAINLLDILFLISYIYGNPPGPAPDPMAAADCNGGDGAINLLDILYLISYIYGNPPGPAPVCQ